MEDIYILFYLISIVLSSLFTVLFIKRKLIVTKLVNLKNKRKLDREKRLKSFIIQVVYDYLNELKNESSND